MLRKIWSRIFCFPFSVLECNAWNVHICLFFIVSDGCDSVLSHYERNIELRVFEDRVMRIVFEPEKRKQMMMQKNANGEPRAWSLSPNIIRFLKWRRIWWAGPMTCICGRTGEHSSFGLENMKKDHLENICLDWKTIRALVLKEQEETIWALCFSTENGDTCEHWFTKCGKFFTLFHEVIYLFSPSVSQSILVFYSR
jgi:hypothetical protein